MAAAEQVRKHFGRAAKSMLLLVKWLAEFWESVRTVRLILVNSLGNENSIRLQPDTFRVIF